MVFFTTRKGVELINTKSISTKTKASISPGLKEEARGEVFFHMCLLTYAEYERNCSCLEYIPALLRFFFLLPHE